MLARKIIKPKLNITLEKKRFEDIINNDLIEGYIFEDESTINLVLENIEFSMCRFERVIFDGKLDKLDFLDVIFNNCDLSNIDLSNRSLHRVAFNNCKLVGTNFAECSLEDITFTDCSLAYSNFSNSHIKDVSFSTCNLKEASFNEVSWKYLYFTNCNFNRTEFLHTSLNQLDFTTCDIAGIYLDISNLRGMIVTSYQAIDLSRLLGLVIDDTNN